MTNQVLINSLRATDANGAPVASAEIRFFKSGTNTPVSVYQDEALTTAHTTPVVANAQGFFPQMFIASSTPLKIEVTDTGGNYLMGSPFDPVAMTTTSSSGADGVSFSPVDGNSGTNVQRAIEINTERHENRSADVKDLLGASNDAEFRTKLGLGSVATADLIDEDDMASDSATRPPSQQSVKAYVGTKGITQSTGEAPYYGARAWGRFAYDGTTLTITNSENVASITRDSTGVYTVNLTNAMPSANFAVIANYALDITAPAAANNDGQVIHSDFTASSFKLTVTNGAGVLQNTHEALSFVIFG